MPRAGDRRPFITDHAVAVLAEGGARELTHHAVDRAAGLPVGSTSYYFRTRHALVVASIGRIRERSRTAFDAAEPPTAITAESAAELIAHQLLQLAEARRHDSLAVFALVAEVQHDPELRGELSSCLFSRELATELLRALGARDPEEESLNLIDFLVGLLFGLLFGQRRIDAHTSRRLVAAIRSFLLGIALNGSSDPDD